MLGSGLTMAARLELYGRIIAPIAARSITDGRSR